MMPKCLILYSITLNFFFPNSLIPPTRQIALLTLQNLDNVQPYLNTLGPIKD